MIDLTQYEPGTHLRVRVGDYDPLGTVHIGRGGVRTPHMLVMDNLDFWFVNNSGVGPFLGERCPITEVLGTMTCVGEDDRIISNSTFWCVFSAAVFVVLVTICQVLRVL